MGAENKDGMIDELLAAGRRVSELREAGDLKGEQELLLFMDGMWDRLPREQRTQVESALREEGLSELADRIQTGREDLS